MNIWDVDKLILFIAFVIPGFISIKAYQLLFPGTERPASTVIVDAIAYSCINYALLSIPIYFFDNSSINNTLLVFLFYTFVLFVAPILIVIFWKLIRTRNFFQKNAPHPTSKPWDYVFSKRKCYWIKVVLKDGTLIGGKYSRDSFASSAPAGEQIYLEETWILDEDGAFIRKKNLSAGVIILTSEISHIELREFN
ncbi:hypothetical protein IG389_02795 [Idiomarina abyssalis]|uniref:Uncharacterized protein n=1 Tax=Idiomarina abyssalis TaxID=86102 RepID=A0A8I1G8L3_9GAMM|nr:DUF6338 family protein [Idiomarina abyssalis]MBJ7266097.1 hypothetical protein [Idiomarina abyssalis]MBJ7272846.1 hypothetical protein [Idiomarina abyssalis]MBJ7316236.1 hypothetical protein [Idiomarina abyssalis]